jgi:hypothetical protein
VYGGIGVLEPIRPVIRAFLKELSDRPVKALTCFSFNRHGNASKSTCPTLEKTACGFFLFIVFSPVLTYNCFEHF